MKLTVNPFATSFQRATHLGEGKKGGKDDPEKLREVAQEFEALMLEQMVKEMRKAVPKSPLLGREMDQEMFNEMLDGEYVRLMTQRGGIGLTDFLVKAFDKGGK